MVAKRLFRSAAHLDADPARRIEGVAELPADSDELAALLAADPAPEVRRRRGEALRGCRRADRCVGEGDRSGRPMPRSPRRWARRSPRRTTPPARRISSIPTPAPTRSAPTSRAARRMRSGAAARSRRSATKPRSSISRSPRSTRRRARRPRSACARRRGCASSPTRPAARIAAWPGTRASGSTRMADREGQDGRSGRHPGGAGGAGAQARSDPHRGDRARSPLGGAAPCRRCGAASRAAKPPARRCRRASIASTRSSARARASSTACATGSRKADPPATSDALSASARRARRPAR